jgi:hypothetical protein
MRLSSLFGPLGPFNEVNKLVCQLPQIALERLQIGTFLRECQKPNGKPLQYFNIHDHRGAPHASGVNIPASGCAESGALGFKSRPFQIQPPGAGSASGSGRISGA